MTINDHLKSIAKELLRGGITADQAIGQFEKEYLTAALEERRGNVTQASRLLGMHRNTLHNKLRTLLPDVRAARKRRSG